MPPLHIFQNPVETLARDLVGATLTLDNVGGIIVETEAYARDDPASHSFRGQTSRNAAMFGPPGTIYVYRSYGIHWCVNIVGRVGEAVLIRALEPTHGLETMRERRGQVDDRRLCKGPGCVTQALGIDARHNGDHLYKSPLKIELPAQATSIVIGQRIGISKGVDAPWRFGLAGNAFVSRPFK